MNGMEEGGQYYISPPVTSSDLKQERSFFRRSLSAFLQLVVAKRGGKGLGKTLASCQCFGQTI